VRDSVVLVLQPQPVPVHSCLKVALVSDIDDNLRALLDIQGGPGIEPL
jgi:hypothetical protein